MPATSTSVESSPWRAQNASTAAAAAGLPIKPATSKVKKSHGSRKRSTVAAVMWSASTKYAPCQPTARTAASAASRTLAGSEPTTRCSRFDLFHTGVTSTPRRAASTNAVS